MSTNPNLVAIVSEAVYCDYRVLAEMTDGSIIEVASPYGDCIVARRLLSLTREQLVAEVRDANAMRRHEANISLHERKVATLGWDYRSRGYR